MAGGLTGTPAPPNLPPPVGEVLPPVYTHTHPTTTTTTSPDHLPGKGKASQQNFPCHLSCPVLVSACPCCDWYGLVGFSAFLHGTCHCHSPTWVEHLLPNRGSNQRSDRLHKEKSPLFLHSAGTRR